MAVGQTRFCAALKGPQNKVKLNPGAQNVISLGWGVVEGDSQRNWAGAGWAQSARGRQVQTFWRVWLRTLEGLSSKGGRQATGKGKPGHKALQRAAAAELESGKRVLRRQTGVQTLRQTHQHPQLIGKAGEDGAGDGNRGSRLELCWWAGRCTSRAIRMEGQLPRNLELDFILGSYMPGTSKNWGCLWSEKNPHRGKEASGQLAPAIRTPILVRVCACECVW